MAESCSEVWLKIRLTEGVAKDALVCKGSCVVVGGIGDVPI